MIYLVLMIVTFLMLCCMILPGVPPSAVTGATGILICFVPLLLAGAILSTMRLNSARGNACHLNFTDISYIDVSAIDSGRLTDMASFTTFAMNGDALKALFVMQLAFLCPMQCCILCAGSIGTLVLTSA